MKTLLKVVSLLLLGAFLTSCEEKTAKAESKAQSAAKAELNAAQGELPEELQDPEDCDDKAKDVLEKEPAQISLQGGDTGCSIE